MKKLLAMLLAALLLGGGALGLAGCGETPEEPTREEPPSDEPVLEYGFGDDGGDPQLSFPETACMNGKNCNCIFSHLI